MSGEIDMGEYLTASFNAKKRIYPIEQQPIRVPSGRPQSS